MRCVFRLYILYICDAIRYPLFRDAIALSFVEEITAAAIAAPYGVMNEGMDWMNPPYGAAEAMIMKELRLWELDDETLRLHADHHVAHQIVYNVVCDMLSKCCALEHIILDGLCLPTTSFETSSQFARIMTTSWTQLQTVDMVFTTFSVCYGVWRKTAKSHTLFPEKLSL